MRSERSLNNQLNLRTEKMTSKNDGGPLSLTCKSGTGTAREISACEYKSVPGVERSFAPSLVGAAFAAGEREAALRGMVPQSTLPPEEYPGSPATCKVCGGPLDCVDASRICTACVERRARSEEYLDALQHGYRPDEHGDWRRI